jgi:hypothetical protein
MANEVKAKVGTKLSDAEVKALDPKDVGRMSAQPKKLPVEGQWVHQVYQICPCCGCGGYGWESTIQYRYFTCHCCGCTFRA